MITPISIPSELSLVGNPIYYAFKVEHAELPANHQVLVNVFFEDEYLSDDFGTDGLVCLEGKVDGDGEICFDLKSILKVAFENSRETILPPWNTQDAYLADNLRRFKIQFTEKYGDPAQEQEWIDSNIFEVMWGAIDQERFVECDFFDSLEVRNSLLHHYPKTKRISLEQPEYLKWFNYTGEEQNVLIELKRWTAEGEISSIYPGHYAGVQVSQNRTIIIPIGVAQIPDWLDETILKYEVRLIDATSEWENGNPSYLSQSRIYYTDCKEYECLQFLTYFNVFGLPETLRLIGETKLELEVKRQQFTGVLNKNYQSTQREVQQYSQTWKNIFTYRTGYLSKDEVIALQELLIYNDAYLSNAEGYRPLYIESKKFNITECFQFLHFLQFDAIRSLKAVDYSSKWIPCEVIEEEEPPPIEEVCCCKDGLEFTDGVLSFGGYILKFTDNCCCKDSLSFEGESLAFNDSILIFD